MLFESKLMPVCIISTLLKQTIKNDYKDLIPYILELNDSQNPGELPRDCGVTKFRAFLFEN